MHVHFEENTCTRTDSNFLSLSWMGKVPEDLPEEGGGWKLNRAQYYVEGWLATGNAKGVVGVTFSTSHCHQYQAPPRSNFNLRGHRSEVVLVRWNEPYQKLATCDSRGVIFVWIKHEGRWSIELINDRNSQVTDFAWSHDGRMALICYHDGFILVGSVAGQRYWSSMLNLDNTNITCGVWSPDDSQVMFGTQDGQILVMSSSGAVVTQVAVHEGFEISCLAWSCEKFNMDEASDSKAEDGSSSGSSSNNQPKPPGEENGTTAAAARPNGEAAAAETLPKSHVLAVCFKYGDIILMSGYDDLCPVMISTSLSDVKVDWSNCGEYLALGGFVRVPSLPARSEVRFYSKEGNLIHCVTIPSQGRPLSAMTWGHNDKRLFLAAGCYIYVAWVSKQVAPLQFLCQRMVHRAVRNEKSVERLPLPHRMKCGVKALFSPTIKSYIPDPLRLREFVCSPPPGGERLFCTMIRHGEETSGGHYTLYLEYLGGLVPLLKGKRASKLRPDFIIFDPKIKSSGKDPQPGNAIESESSSESEAEVYTDGCGSPRMQRRRRHKVFRAEKVNRSITFRTLDELMYDDNLPETTRLVEVTSNIWGTKFQITGVSSSLPACLGQVVYKTSLLHLQPRQMTITIGELTPARLVLARDPNFTPAPLSDDEDSSWTSVAELAMERKTVEVTVHDIPSLTSSEQGSPCRHMGRRESGPVENGIRSVQDSPLIEHGTPASNDLSSLAGKLSSSGTVRSRSLSPVRNSLTQSAPAFKPDRLGRESKQEGSAGWQGARPKASDLSGNNKCIHNNSSISSTTSSTTTTPTAATTTTTITSSSVAIDTGSITSSPIASVKSSLGITSSKLSTSTVSTATSIPGIPSHATSCLYSHCNGTGSTSPVHSMVQANNKLNSHMPLPSSVSAPKKFETFANFKKVEVVDMAIVGAGGDDFAHSSKTEHSGIVESSGTGSPDSIVLSSVGVEHRQGAGPRWADPVPIKLLEEESAICEAAPFENNLVGDCSPTAPNCLDLQRRLYLAQQNFTDTDAPISPSGCPSCVPALFSPLAAAHFDVTSQHSSRGMSESSQKSSHTKHSHRQSVPVVISSSELKQCAARHRHSAVESSVTPLSESLSTGFIPSSATSQSPPDSQFNFCPNCKSKQENSFQIKGMTGSKSDTSSDSSVLSRNIATANLHGLHGTDLSSPQKGIRTYPGLDPSSSSASSYFTRERISTPVAPVNSGLPGKLSSIDQLNLILSEGPEAQHSPHNFRSMPGFSMRNPDLFPDSIDSCFDEAVEAAEKALEDDASGLLNSNSLSHGYENNTHHALNNTLTQQDLETIQQTSASLPSSPLRLRGKTDPDAQLLQEEMMRGRCKHLSPLLRRKDRDSPMSSQDVYLGMEDFRSYHNLEAFQKAQLRQKMRKRLVGSSGHMDQVRTFTMHNKAPLWNETSQVYQLDFGGRVTQESAKNFQIELKGKQVMQFGRIDNNAYTLDFQYPFTAVQAFAVALANVTQRLK